ncbi:MAG: alpha/beta fold hydrolase [Actinomycetota bacterium]
MTAVPVASANDIEICHEIDGPDDGEPLVLINGLGSQLVRWEPEWIELLVTRGFRVITLDNRDVGHSSWFDHVDLDPMAEFAKVFEGGEPSSAYTLSDMAADTVALLDHLEVGRAHVVGVSMGGMIAQTAAIEHPDRVASLTSVMSNTGEPGVGAPTPAASEVLTAPAPTDRDGYIDHCTEGNRVYGSEAFWDEEAVRGLHAREYDRGFHPAGTGRHLLAVLASGDRVEGLRSLRVPTAVVHGAVDPLVQIDGGRRTAELVPDAEFVEIADMAHDLPPEVWDQVADAIDAAADRAATANF